MAITLKGDGTIEGLAVGGLPNSTVKEEDLAFTIDSSGSDTNTVTGGRVRQCIQTLNNTQTVNQDVGSFDMRRATIPQITEGIEVLSATITPTTADSILLIQSLVHLGPASDGHRYAIMLFQDDTTDALEMATTLAQSGGDMQDLSMQFRKIAGTTSPITFSVRVAPQSGQGVFINRGNVSLIGGGSLNSSLVVWEITEGIDALDNGNGGNTNPPSAPSDGILFGGNVGSLVNGSVFTYAFASAVESVVGSTIENVSEGCNTASPTHGYYSGGASASSPDNNLKIRQYALVNTNDLTTVGNLAVRRIDSHQGCSSETVGYHVTGRDTVGGFQSNVQKFTFANENIQATNDGINTEIAKAGLTHSTTTHGYTFGGTSGGGNNPVVVAVTTVSRFSFASDTVREDLSPDLNERSGGHATVGNNTVALICGGGNTTNEPNDAGFINVFYNRIDSYLLASSASISDHGTLGPNALTAFGAVARTSTSGILIGGTESGQPRSVDKLEVSFASNSTASLLSTLTREFSQGIGYGQVAPTF